MTAKTRGIKSIEVGGRILTELIRSSAPMMLKDLAVSTGLTPAQVHAYLTSFRASGLVEQDQHTGLYRVGHFAIRLGAGRIHHDECLSETRMAVDRLSAELGLMVAMVVLGPHGPTVVYIQMGDNPLDINIRPGTQFSVIGTASGKLFAAFCQDNRIKKLVEEELANKDQSPIVGHHFIEEDFDKAIEKIRKQQYSYVEGAPIPGINAVTAPIYNNQKEFVAAITLIGRDRELSVAEDGLPLRRLLEVAHSISCGSD